jgi:thymidylate synthase
MFYKGIIKELLFFISGKTNSKILENEGVNIWKGNTSREFLDSRGLNHLKEGDMGASYPFQLRHWNAEYINCDTDYTNQGFDQLQYVIDEIKNNPTSRRILFNYWNPSYLDKTCLPSCHLMYIFNVNMDKKELSCSFTQRSQDYIIANGFNIVSASILTMMICKLTGLNPGKIIQHIGNIHIYKSHIEETKKMLNNTPYNFPILHIIDSKDLKTIDDFKYEHFNILLYKSHSRYKFEMSV